MPCYRFRFNHELPLYYHGHCLPSPLIKIILEYGYEMTVREDMETLHDKLEEVLGFLRSFKESQKGHLRAYDILRTQNSGADRICKDSSRLCHDATVNLVTAMCTRPRRGPSFFEPSTAPAPPTQNNNVGFGQGFVLPEMTNYT